MLSTINRGYVCFEQPVTTAEAEALMMYWDVDFEEMSFKFKVTDINNEFAPTVTNIASLARSKSSYCCDLSNFRCMNCGVGETIRIRSNFKEQANSYGYTCEDCLEKQEKKVLARFTEVLDSYTDDLYNSTFDYNELSYMEKLALFLLLSEYHREDGGPLYCDAKRFSLTGCHQTDRDFIAKFVEKGAILVIEERSVEIKALKKEFHAIREKKFKFHESKKSTCLRVNYDSPEMETYASGMYLRFSNYSNAMELQTALYADICERKLTKSDIEDFQHIVERSRISLLYDVARAYADEFNFTFESSMKLDNLLKYLAKNFKLPVISNYLHQRALNVSSQINQNPVPGYIKNKLFAKEIDVHLTKAKSRGWNIVYEKFLPGSVDTPLLESFTCNHFFENEFNWFDLTMSEIIEKWAAGVDLNFQSDTLSVRSID